MTVTDSLQVKEHGRKVAKAARKSGNKAKPPADPGMPKQWPFKQELINELAEKKRLILAAEAKKKDERKRARVGRCQHLVIICAGSTLMERKVDDNFTATSDIAAPSPVRALVPTLKLRCTQEESRSQPGDDAMGDAPSLEALQAQAGWQASRVRHTPEAGAK